LAELSYVHGVSETPLTGATIGNLFDQTVQRWRNHDALAVPFQNVRWTWGELQKRVNELAAGFIALGLKPEDRVGIWSPNNAEWVLTQLATAKAGLILVNINPAYRLPELQYALNKTSCRALIFAPNLRDSNYLEMLSELMPNLSSYKPGHLQDEAIPTLRWLISLDDESHNGVLNFNAISSLSMPGHREQLFILGNELQFDDPINIQFTSGTTGTPKAATLTHHNIVNNACFVGQRMALTAEDRVCIPVPMYHCFGMVLGSLCCVAHGATMVFASPGFDAHETLKTIHEERCTAVHGVPTMFIAMLDDCEFSTFDLSTLRTGIMAGAPCPEELMKRVIMEMHLKQITIAYGMTETGPVSFQTSVDDSLDRRVKTVGSVLPHIEIKIVDQDKRVLPRETAGELLTRGYCVMPGYWDDQEKTTAAIDDAGWIESGDIAIIDEQGYCQIVGRSKDMLIRGGENIFPREIEEFLYQHPKIDQVQVIGVPDPKYGEEICAWIKLHGREKATQQEIVEFCRGKIAHYKIPKYIMFVDEFPMTVTGKIQKYIMREKMAEMSVHNMASLTA
jgi:fatty-acyl-CoA synthase